jgi:CheY-like chemotaxis protein
VLLDLAMPGLCGYEVARQLRPLLPAGACLIAMTALGFEEDRRRTREAGFDHHFVKPADPAAVLALLGEIAARCTAGAPAPQPSTP